MKPSCFILLRSAQSNLKGTKPDFAAGSAGGWGGTQGWRLPLFADPQNTWLGLDGKPKQSFVSHKTGGASTFVSGRSI